MASCPFPIKIIMLLLTGGLSLSGQATGDNAPPIHEVLPRFKLEPLKATPGEWSLRWVVDEAFGKPRAMTVTIRGDQTSVSIVECDRTTLETLGAIRFRGQVAGIATRLEPTLLWLEREGEFWRPLTSYERIFADRAMDGLTWWFEFAGPKEHKTIVVPNAMILAKAHPTDPEIREVTRYLELVDELREILIAAGIKGWQPQPPAQP